MYNYCTNKICSHDWLCLYNLQWLEKEFLPYLDAWESSVKEREGFSKLAQKQMLLSPETLLGLQITGMFFQPFSIVLVFLVTYNFPTLQHPALFLFFTYIFSEVVCGAGEIHLHHPWCYHIPKWKVITRPSRKVLWMPEATRWREWKPKRSWFLQEHSSFESDSLYMHQFCPE